MDRRPLIYVLISAALFGLSAPLAKLLLVDIPPVALAGLLYLGAFLGLSLYSLLIQKKVDVSEVKSARLEKRDFPWLFGAILAGGVLAPISLMMGLNLISGFSTSLLLNLEGLCTTIIAVVVFRENTGKSLWVLFCLV